MNTTTPDELLTYPQAAQRLGVDVRWIQKLVRTEQLAFVLDSRGRRRIPASEISGH